jgi:hypothetical protein
MKKQFSALKKSFFFLAMVFMTMPVFSQSTLLVGSWRLTAADKILPDGSRVPDFGMAPHGIAIFTVDGHYVVEIFRADRKKLAPDQYKDAVQSISCHFGTYTVDAAKGTITFHVDRASFANWDETTQVRNFTLEGDTLSWRVAPRPDGSIPVSVFSRIP